MPFNRISFDYIGQLADKIEEIYYESQIDIPNNSELCNVIKDVRFIISGYHLSRNAGLELLPSISYSTAIKNASCFSLIAESIVNAYENFSNRVILKKHLTNIAKYPLLPYSPVNQRNHFGKDSAYELFFIKFVMDAGYKVDLLGEPDNIIHLSGGRKIGIHCKHPYSWRRLSRNFNIAVRQVNTHKPRLPKIISLSMDEFFRHYLFQKVTFLNEVNVEEIENRVDEFLRQCLCRLETTAKAAHRSHSNLIAVATTLSTVVFVERERLISAGKRALILSLVNFESSVFRELQKFKDAIENPHIRR